MAITREEFVERIGDIPTLPFIAAKLLDLVSDAASSAVDVARVIAYDQATSTRLLRLANSAHFSLGRRVTTIRDAVVLIGYEGVRRIALGLAVLDHFAQGSAASGLDFARLWLHAIGVGCAARELAPRVEVGGEEAFVCGLLHDVGKVALASLAPEDYGRAVQRAAEGTTIREAEREVFGFSHDDVAALILGEWRFPEQVTLAAARHHEPRPGTHHCESVALVHAGDGLVRQAMLGYPGDMVTPTIDPWARDLLRLQDLDTAEFAMRVTAHARERWKALMPSG